ncbi:Uncharacterised protein [Mesomycoplasma hyorhinis]|nr:Uncharacterised protein [Mesomycoplasma hyorhinis]
MVGTTCDCVFGLLFISDLLFEILDGVELLVIDSGGFDALIDALLRLTAGLYAQLKNTNAGKKSKPIEDNKTLLLFIFPRFVY